MSGPVIASSQPPRRRFRQLTPTVLGLTAPLLLAGCGIHLIEASGEKVVGQDEKRVTVDYESEQAMETFAEAVADRYPHDKNLGSSSFKIPFLVHVRDERRTLSRNAYFNDQVDVADLNSDDTISEAEARIYANPDREAT